MNQDMSSAPAPAPVPVEPRKNNTWLIVGIVVVVLCICCLGAAGISYVFYQNGDKWFGTGASLLGAMHAARMLIV